MPLTRGHGQDYININKIYNKNHTGCMDWIRPLEDEIIQLTVLAINTWDKPATTSKQIRELYEGIDKKVILTYRKHGYDI